MAREAVEEVQQQCAEDFQGCLAEIEANLAEAGKDTATLNRVVAGAGAVGTDFQKTKKTIENIRQEWAEDALESMSRDAIPIESAADLCLPWPGAPVSQINRQVKASKQFMEEMDRIKAKKGGLDVAAFCEAARLSLQLPKCMEEQKKALEDIVGELEDIWQKRQDNALAFWPTCREALSSMDVVIQVCLKEVEAGAAKSTLQPFTAMNKTEVADLIEWYSCEENLSDG